MKLKNFSRLQRLASAAIGFSVVILAGCATSMNPPPSADAQLPSHDYLIGPGDSVNITVWRNPEVSQTVPVRPDGKITIPGIGDVKASGFTPPGLQKSLGDRLKQLIKNPNVTVRSSDSGFIPDFFVDVK